MFLKKRVTKMTSNRDGHNIGCIYCGPTAKKPFPGDNDFFTVVKEARDFWDFEKNEMDPLQLLAYSAKRAYFTCPEKKHIEFRKIADFSKSPMCQTCKKEENLLITEIPLTKLFFDKGKNSLPLNRVIRSARGMFNFKCPECGFEWEEQLLNWRKRQHCKCCGFDGTEGSQERNKKLVEEYGIITFRMAYPEEAEWWDYAKNGNATPDNTLSMSSKEIWFICNEQKHSFKKSCYSFCNKRGCKYCNNPNLIERKTLFEKVPVAKIMWDYEKNEGLDPNKLYPYSSQKAWFICPDKQHSFYKKIVNFTNNPYCAACKAIKKSIPYKAPELLKFWDYDKNDILPEEVLPYSNQVINWKCPDCGYEWIQKVCNRRTAEKGKCPSCDMGRVFDENSKESESTLLKCRPEVVEFWDYKLNTETSPDKISSKSTKQVYLKCSKNKLHSSFPIEICKIPSNPPYGCPQCEQEYQESILFVNVCPEVRTMWDDELNPGVDINTLKNWQKESFNFKCLKGHVFSRSISSYVNNQSCPYCTMDTVAKNPDLVKQWDFKRNKHIILILRHQILKNLYGGNAKNVDMNGKHRL